MKSKKPTIDDYVNAIIDRDDGEPYPDVLADYKITPNQFYRAVNQNSSDLVRLTRNYNAKQRLQEILSNHERRRELFKMGEDFLHEQYDRLMGRIPKERQSRLYEGTCSHPENIENLVYYALVSNNPILASHKREEVIAGIKELPSNLHAYLYTLGLSGLMMSAFPKGKQGSPLAVLEVFDKAYQRRTEDKSLFDLTQKEHLHRWGDYFVALRGYWRKPANVEEAVYHTLTESNPQLASTKREEVIAGIKELPSNLKDYLYTLGLAGLMQNAFPKGKQNSPLAVLEVFDKAYQRRTEDKSLFDKTQTSYLEINLRNKII